MKEKTGAVAAPAKDQEVRPNASYLAQAMRLSTLAGGLFGIPTLKFDQLAGRRNALGEWLH
jgi:hypothetical protein